MYLNFHFDLIFDVPLLTKIYGIYSLQMYISTMQNILGINTNAIIENKYLYVKVLSKILNL